jgi:hypothetical protein
MCDTMIRLQPDLRERISGWYATSKSLQALLRRIGFSEEQAISITREVEDV